MWDEWNPVHRDTTRQLLLLESEWGPTPMVWLSPKKLRKEKWTKSISGEWNTNSTSRNQRNVKTNNREHLSGQKYFFEKINNFDYPWLCAHTMRTTSVGVEGEVTTDLTDTKREKNILINVCQLLWLPEDDTSCRSSRRTYIKRMGVKCLRYIGARNKAL